MVSFATLMKPHAISSKLISLLTWAFMSFANSSNAVLDASMSKAANFRDSVSFLRHHSQTQYKTHVDLRFCRKFLGSIEEAGALAADSRLSQPVVLLSDNRLVQDAILPTLVH